MDKKKDLASKLRTSGLRPTKQRIKLAEFLFNREKTFHFTVENLDKAINKKSSDDKIALAIEAYFVDYLQVSTIYAPHYFFINFS